MRIHSFEKKFVQRLCEIANYIVHSLLYEMLPFIFYCLYGKIAALLGCSDKSMTIDVLFIIHNSSIMREEYRAHKQRRNRDIIDTICIERELHPCVAND